MILEANLNYRIGSSFDTITKRSVGERLEHWLSTAFPIACAPSILTYAYISRRAAQFCIIPFAEMSLNVPARAAGFASLRCWWRLLCAGVRRRSADGDCAGRARK